MWNIIILGVIVYLAIKSKRIIVRLWSSLDSTTKLQIIERPTHYRNYNDYIHLSEIIHWDVVPRMGESISIIKSDMNSALKLILDKNTTDPDITMQELANQWDTLGRDFRNYELFRVFFKTIAVTVPTTRYRLSLVVAFINTAV